MNWFDEQKAIAERLVAVMADDFQHEQYEHSLESAMTGLIRKLEERDQEISRLRAEIEQIKINNQRIPHHEEVLADE